jgi:2',3'-cyclic-nucleotide 2'-phosphodiesterase (5'-nucleotidase family)
MSTRIPAGLWLLIAVQVACAPERTTRPVDQLTSPASPSSPIVISIVGTNDLHGGILPRDGRGGLALLGGYINNLRAVRAHDGAMLLIDAGDMFQGTLESNLGEGATVVAAYNALGYTAATIGNHEFDFGPVGPAVTPAKPGDDPRGALKARAAEATFAVLAANLIDDATKRAVEWPNVRPSVVVEAAGLQVGIVGVMTLRALAVTMSANVKGLSVAPLAATIAAQATDLRIKGAQIVVVTAHAGGRCSSFAVPTDLSSCAANAEIFQVADALAPGLVDVIVAGHSHAGMAHVRNGVAIIESFTGGRTFGRVDLTVDPASRRVTNTKIFPPQEVVAAGDYEGRPIVPDATVAAVIEPQLQRVRDLKARPLGVVLDTPIVRAAPLESPLGNFFTDVLLESVPGADIAINNTGGGLRADLPAGLLTYGSLFEAYPFDNVIVTLTISGGDLKRALARGMGGGRLPGIAGLRARATCVAGGPRVDLLRRDGRTVGDNERVTFVTTEFLATGGEGWFTPGLGEEDIGQLVRDAAAQWLERRGGHLRDRDLVNLENPRWLLAGPPPLQCR